uniref:Uncharacterized protein n=1 Tax=Lactuca sativa TaxID=4236 RepID=A0A9R1UFF2_LACSA|nr:hypothetical protein LSAT_V11C900468810 [Lactuca sativa]
MVVVACFYYYAIVMILYMTSSTPERIPPFSVLGCDNTKKVVFRVIETFERITKSQEECVLREKFATFHMKKALFNGNNLNGYSDPEHLQKKVHSQPITSYSAQRSWSTYSYYYIDSVKRNCKKGRQIGVYRLKYSLAIMLF